MEHCIWVTSLDNKTIYLPGHMILTMNREENNHTLISMSNGSAILVKTAVEQVHARYNKYCDEIFEFNSKLKGNDDFDLP